MRTIFLPAVPPLELPEVGASLMVGPGVGSEVGLDDVGFELGPEIMSGWGLKS